MMERRERRQRLVWAGVAFTLVTLFVLVSAMNTGANLLYLVGGGLISFLILSVMLSRWGLKGLAVFREAPASAHREEPFAVTIRVENRKLAMPAMSVRIESTARRGESIGYVLKIPARKAAIVRVTEVLGRRGVHKLPALELVTGFPFGLIEARTRVSDSVEVVIYPRIFPIRTGVLERLSGIGDIQRRTSADGDEFHSLRDYVRGDDPRRIAWRPSARLRALVVREMEAESTRTVTLFLDTRRMDGESFEDRFEEAVDLTASLAAALLMRRFAVALVTPTLQLPEGEGISQRQRIMEALARVDPVDPSAVPVFPSAGQSRGRQGSAHLLVSPDASSWGLRGGAGMRIFDPREVIRA